jgi:NAD(P)-dependent dehydrogenase (short-subunit alcohol dehydrogenase family)
MPNFLIIGANSPMIETFLLDINKNQKNKIFLFINNEKKFLNGIGSKLNMNNVQFFSCDLLNEEIYQLLENIKVPIDSFCYVAGSTHLSLIKFTKKIDIEKVFEINFFKPLFITQYLLRKKLITPKANFVYISSISGEGSVAAGISSYSTSKAALNNLVKVLTIECKSLKLKFNTICPGIVNTDFNIVVDDVKTDDNDQLLSRYPLGFGMPSDISTLINYLLVENTWITGQNIIIDGGFSIN